MLVHVLKVTILMVRVRQLPVRINFFVLYILLYIVVLLYVFFIVYYCHGLVFISVQRGLHAQRRRGQCTRSATWTFRFSRIFAGISQRKERSREDDAKIKQTLRNCAKRLFLVF